MGAIQQLPTHGDGLLDLRELARTLLETRVNEIMGGHRQGSCALSDSPIGPPSGTATRRAASRPGSGGTPIRSQRRT